MGYMKCETCQSWFETGKGVCKCPIGVTTNALTSIRPADHIKPPVRVTVQPIRSPQVAVTSAASDSGAQKGAIADDLERLRQASEVRRGGPANFAGKYAYRGVNSGPDVYEERGGFMPHQIKTLPLAISKLRNLVNTNDGLSQYAQRWQEKKNQEDGFFLSTGLSEVESYDNYPYLYRIDIGGLVKRSWDGFTVKPEAIENCVLYTNNADFGAATMIAIICLAGGLGRSYELLIMSPVPPALCQVAHPKGSKTYLSFEEWKASTKKL